MRAPGAANGPPTQFKAGLARYQIAARLFGDLRAYILEYVESETKYWGKWDPQTVREWTLEAIRRWLEVQ